MRPHDYSDHERLYAEAALHYRTLGPGLQYHFSISNLGDIYNTRPLNEWLYVVGSAENVSTIAIKLDGYFHPPYNQTPTREQYEALYQLLEDLCEHHPEFPATWPDVRPHRDFSSTACCGDLLAPDIYAIQDKASAQEHLLNKGEFDWPSEQPGSPQPFPSPTPAPPAPQTPPPAIPVPPPVTPPTPPVTTPAHDTPPSTGFFQQLIDWLKALLHWQ